MPLLEVELIVSPDEAPHPALAAELADAAAAVFGSPPGHVWVRLHLLPGTHYAENGGQIPGSPRPAFISVLHGRSPTGPDREAEAEALTNTLASVLGRPRENVHLIYLADGAGRVFFGGRAVA